MDSRVCHRSQGIARRNYQYTAAGLQKYFDAFALAGR